MRLLHAKTLDFHEFASLETAPPYIITSHRWLDGEVSYEEVLRRKNDALVDKKPGMQKIKKFCGFVKEWQAHINQRLGPATISGQPPTVPEFIWIDTCCIDKRSSAELQETITTMHQYYAKAWCCIAYLHDVQTRECSPLAVLQSFKESVWFTRGWTLQELLAPKCVMFADRDWKVFGHKSPLEPLMFDESTAVDAYYLKMPLNQWISQASGIDEAILWDYDKAQSVSFKDRLAWMNKRTTTRAEDRAYCMLGLCEVYIPLMYGEGLNAMKRLYKEIGLPVTSISSFCVQTGPTTKQGSTAELKNRTPSEQSGANCQECTKRSVTCSGNQPRCTRCVRKGVSCWYGPDRSKDSDKSDSPDRSKGSSKRRQRPHSALTQFFSRDQALR
ncbi:unnamed protein product [Zymoseptoria tritici ST99CH_3D1]|nr:unnamed protein product [Zymoseptoria tritici ST99CH_3D1]